MANGEFTDSAGTITVMRLRYAEVCAGEDVAVCQADAEAPAALDVGIAGAAALREYERRKAKDDAARSERSALWRALNGFFYPDGRHTTNAWKVGAAGEERVAGALTMLPRDWLTSSPLTAQSRASSALRSPWH